MAHWTTIIYECESPTASWELGAVIDQKFGPHNYSEKDTENFLEDYRPKHGLPRHRHGDYVYLHHHGTEHNENDFLEIADEEDATWERVLIGEISNTTAAGDFRLFNRREDNHADCIETLESTEGSYCEDAVAFFNREHNFSAVSRVKIESNVVFWDHPPGLPADADMSEYGCITE